MGLIIEVKIKVENANFFNIEEVLKKVRKVEEEYSCHCTHLEIESSAI